MRYGKHLILASTLVLALASGACDGKKDDANAAQTQATTGMAAPQMPGVMPSAGESQGNSALTGSSDMQGDMQGEPGVSGTSSSDMSGSAVWTPDSTGQDIGQDGGPMPPHMTEPVTCPHMDLIGKTKDEVDFNQIKEPHRVIPPGAAVTMDYSPDRVNFQLDENGRIVRIWCG